MLVVTPIHGTDMQFNVTAQRAGIRPDLKDGIQEVRPGFEIPAAGIHDGNGAPIHPGQHGRAERGIGPHAA
jgi:hypothetical protein